MQFPYAEIQMQKDGSIHSQSDVDTAITTIKASNATDVLVLVHGWNNDIPAARQLYRRLTDNIAAVQNNAPPA